MSKRLPFTQASIKRAVAAARKVGLRVTGIGADGTVMVADGDNTLPAVPNGLVPIQTAPPASKWEDAQA